MKIEDIKVFLARPARNFVTVKVITEDGTVGWGDATLNGREKAVVAYLEEHVIPCLIGKDAQQIEDIWHYLYRGAYWRKGPVTMTAIGSIDIALWDIKGKKAGLPVYQLLGGKSRNKIKAYGHANGENIEETLAHLGALIKQGFKAVRLQCALPKSKGTYGTLGKKKDYYELQSNRPLPPVQEWNTAKYLNFIPQLFKTAREQFGYEIDLLHDVHNRLTPIEAAKLAKDLEAYQLLFLEDPVPAENQDSFDLIRKHSTIPLAVGEVFNTIWDSKELISNQSIDYIRMAASHGGGITPLRKMADYAAMHHVRIAPHGAPDLSPICHAAQAHINIWANNFGIQEFVGFGNETMNQVFEHPLSIKDGYLYLEDRPGLGVDYNEVAASKHKYKRSYLPVTRLEDGTLWHW